MKIDHIHILEDIAETQEWLVEITAECFASSTITAASTIAESLQQIKESSPDLALIDLGLPDGSGVEVIKWLNTHSKQTLIVVTTIFEDDEHLFTALKAGAEGYILKDESTDEVISLLKGVIDNKPPLSPSIAKRMLIFFHPEDKSPPQDKLTERETDVLQLIAKGYSTGKTAELLGISRNTGAGYVKNIYRKLNISSRAEASLAASERGLVSTDMS